jgi:hypothetical protein
MDLFWQFSGFLIGSSEFSKLFGVFPGKPIKLKFQKIEKAKEQIVTPSKIGKINRKRISPTTQKTRSQTKKTRKSVYDFWHTRRGWKFNLLP